MTRHLRMLLQPQQMILIVSIVVYHIYGAVQYTVPEDGFANTQVLKYLVYPLVVIIPMFIYGIVKSTNKIKDIILWAILLVPAISLMSLNIASVYDEGIAKIKGILNWSLMSTIGVILIVYIILFTLGKFVPGQSVLYSFPLWILLFLFVGRVFKVINRLIIWGNSGDNILIDNNHKSDSIDYNEIPI